MALAMNAHSDGFLTGGSPMGDPAVQVATGSRSRRMMWLVTFIVLASAVDLYLTLTFLSGVGMGEANPIARWIMSFECSWLLSAFKASLVLLTCGILIGARRQFVAEVGGWICVLLLTGVMLQWSAYAGEVSSVTGIMHELPRLASCEWVRFDP
jgi:hypothetical protein